MAINQERLAALIAAASECYNSWLALSRQIQDLSPEMRDLARATAPATETVARISREAEHVRCTHRANARKRARAARLRAEADQKAWSNALGSDDPNDYIPAAAAAEQEQI